MNKRKKESIPYTELLKKVQSLLVFYGECRNIQIDGIEVYAEPVDGANWHVNEYRCSGSDNDLTACREKLASEIGYLRACYDVGEDG